ncbi:DUF932 domain-containing protein [Armatimonas rosea]|uniref:DUF932 domain-containing protein n=1 Tax=Armatimonas rosea TaxID=685828 RepID=A0A7W9SXB6_ARMRO|nr:DUF932 domain-containing protein [Armatimonas rosea]MBB6053949.1 hypothetical protein [Armatimonas rosea]
MNLDEVCDRVSADDAGKHDHLVAIHEVSMQHGRLYWPGADDDGFGFALSPWAMGQACTKLGMPAAYFGRCPKELQDTQWNFWKGIPEELRKKAGGDGGQQWTIRAKNSEVRGVLSARYEKLDNRQLLNALLPAIAGSGHEVKLFDLTSESLHLRLIDPRMSRLALPGDPLIVAIHIANSEVGLRAVTVDACIFREVCTNGMVRKIAGRSMLKQRHIHVVGEQFVPLLQDAIAQARLVAAAFIEQMILSTKTIVPDPARAIEVLADAWKLSKQTAEYIKFGLYGETHQDTLYGLVNAVTNAAQRLSVEGRYELETLASVLIDTTSESRADQALRTRILSPKGGLLV